MENSYKYNLSCSKIPVTVKSETNFGKITNCFENVTLSLDEIVTYTQPPYSYSFAPATFTNNMINNESWNSQQIFMLDFDSGITSDEVIERFKSFDITPNFIYYTLSHTDEHPRFRIGLCLDEVIDSYKYGLIIRKGLLKAFPEADKRCVNASRFFLGGNNGNVPSFLQISVEKLLNMLSICSITDSQNQTRKVAEMWDMLCNIYSVSEKNAKNKPSSSFIMTPERKAYLDRVKASKIDINDCISKIKILQDFDSGVWLNHDLLFGLATNLNWIPGGLTYMKKTMLAYNEQGKTSYSSNNFNALKYVHVTKYNPNKLQKFSPYAEDFVYRDIIDCVYTPRGSVKLTRKNTPKISLEEACKKLGNEYLKAIYAQNLNIYIFLVATGVGKTQLLKDLVNSIICCYTHKKKKELSEKGMKVKHVVTPQRPVFENNKLLEKHIATLFEAGLNEKVHQTIKSLANNKLKKFNPSNEEIESAKKYLEDLDAVYKSKDETILTTHQRGIFNLFERNLIVFDEDPIDKLIEIKTLYITDLMIIMTRFKSKKLAKIIQLLQNAEQEKMFENNLDKIDDSKLIDVIEDLKIKSNVIAFMNCVNFYKDKKDPNIIYYSLIKRLPDDKKIMIMSATANVELYKQTYGDRLKVIDISNVENEGKIIQYTDKSYSRYSLNNSDLSNLYENVKDLPVISFKNYDNDKLNIVKDMWFGNCAGYDSLKGKNIAVVGTPHKNEVHYKFYAATAGLNVNDLDWTMKQRNVQWNGFEFRFTTYENEILQKIQMDTIAADLIQAAGRARTVRENCTVKILSNLPLSISDEIIQGNYNINEDSVQYTVVDEEDFD